MRKKKRHRETGKYRIRRDRLMCGYVQVPNKALMGSSGGLDDVWKREQIISAAERLQQDIRAPPPQLCSHILTLTP